METRQKGQLLYTFLLVVVSLCLSLSVLASENTNQGLADFSESANLMGTGGHTQEEAVAWARDRANEHWSQDVDGVYGCQCVDLIKAYYGYLGNSYVLGNACDYQHNALPAGWYRDNTPSPGSIAVWSGYSKLSDTWTLDQYGHIGIVIEVNGANVKTVEANVNGQYAQYVNSRKIAYVKCFIHPDFSQALRVDFSPWDSQRGSTFIAETNASIGQSISVSGGTGTDTGMELYDANGNYLARGANGFFNDIVYFNINEELGYTLTKCTTYKYKFFDLCGERARKACTQDELVS